MRKIIVILFTGVVLFGCNDDKKQETALLNDVIKTHDKLMADDDAIMKNKMALKDIAKSDTTIKDSVAVYSKSLEDADNSMMNWMSKFSPDFTGKSHEQIMTYLNSQKAQILKLDTQINEAIATSNNYILKVKKK
jgi:hypothetical protein